MAYEDWQVNPDGSVSNAKTGETYGRKSSAPLGSPAAPVADKPWTSDLAEVGRQIGASAAVGLPRQLGEAAQWASSPGKPLYNLGSSLRGGADARAPAWAPDMAGRGPIAGPVIEAAGQIVPSMAPVAAAALALPALGLSAPVAAGLGAAATAGLFGASQAQESKESGLAAGLSEEQANALGWKTGAIGGLGEGVGSYLGGKFLGTAGKILKRAATPTAAGLAGAAETGVVKPFAKALGTTALGEAGTEFAQNYGERAVEQQAGVPGEDPLEAGLHGAKVAGGMTALLAPFGLHASWRNAKQNQAALSALADPFVDDQSRLNAAQHVAGYVHQSAGPEAANGFMAQANDAILSGSPIIIGEDGSVDFGNNSLASAQANAQSTGDTTQGDVTNGRESVVNPKGNQNQAGPSNPGSITNATPSGSEATNLAAQGTGQQTGPVGTAGESGIGTQGREKKVPAAKPGEWFKQKDGSYYRSTGPVSGHTGIALIQRDPASKQYVATFSTLKPGGGNAGGGTSETFKSARKARARADEWLAGWRAPDGVVSIGEADESIRREPAHEETQGVFAGRDNAAGDTGMGLAEPRQDNSEANDHTGRGQAIAGDENAPLGTSGQTGNPPVTAQPMHPDRGIGTNGKSASGTGGEVNVTTPISNAGTETSAQGSGVGPAHAAGDIGERARSSAGRPDAVGELRQRNGGSASELWSDQVRGAQTGTDELNGREETQAEGQKQAGSQPAPSPGPDSGNAAVRGENAQGVEGLGDATRIRSHQGEPNQAGQIGEGGEVGSSSNVREPRQEQEGAQPKSKAVAGLVAQIKESTDGKTFRVTGDVLAIRKALAAADPKLPKGSEQKKGGLAFDNSYRERVENALGARDNTASGEPEVQKGTRTEARQDSDPTTTAKAGSHKEGKKTWGMTRDEFIASKRKQAIEKHGEKWATDHFDRPTPSHFLQALQIRHGEDVAQAKNEGKPIPAEVLADYPELAKTKQSTANSESTVAQSEKGASGTRTGVGKAGPVRSEAKQVAGSGETTAKEKTGSSEPADAKDNKRHLTRKEAEQEANGGKVEPYQWIDEEGYTNQAWRPVSEEDARKAQIEKDVRESLERQKSTIFGYTFDEINKAQQGGKLEKRPAEPADAEVSEREQAKRAFEKKWSEAYGDRPTTEKASTAKSEREQSDVEKEQPELTRDEARKVARMSDAELAEYNAAKQAPVWVPEKYRDGYAKAIRETKDKDALVRRVSVLIHGKPGQLTKEQTAELRGSTLRSRAMASQKSTPRELLTALRAELGSGIDKQVASGKVKIVQHFEDMWKGRAIPSKELEDEDLYGATRGAYDDETDTVYLIADSLSEEAAPAVYLHEFVHAKLSPHLREGMSITEALIGKSAYRNAINDLNHLRTHGSAHDMRIIEDAMVALTQAGVHTTIRDEELLAYTVERAFNDKRASSAMRALVRKVLAAIRAWLYRNGINVRLTPDTLVELTQWAASTSVEQGIGGKVVLRERGDIQPTAPNILRSRASPKDNPEGVFADIDKAITSQTEWRREKGNAVDKWDQLKGTVRRHWLGALSVRQLAEVGKTVLPRITQYTDQMQAMNATRGKVIDQVDRIVEDWRKLDPKNKQRNLIEQGRIAYAMHESTQAGVDAAEGLSVASGEKQEAAPYKPSIDVAATLKKIRAITKQAMSRPGEDKAKMIAEVKDLKNSLAFERNRAANYERIAKIWNGLSAEGQEIYIRARDYHVDQSKRVESALRDMIDFSDMSGKAKAAHAKKLQQEFEAARVQAPYFPLNRDGDYWVSVEQPDGIPAFEMFQTIEQQEAFIKEQEKSGNKIRGRGKKTENLRDIIGVSSGFVSAVEGVLKDLGDHPAVEAARDQVWQLYLATLPELSARKHFIHRKKTPGYGKDALLAFAKKGYHDAYQYARLVHATPMRNILDDIKGDIAAENSAQKLEQTKTELALVREFLDEVAGKMAQSKIAEKVRELGARAPEHKEVMPDLEKWRKFQEWGEDYARTGDVPKALEHKRKVLEGRLDAVARISARKRGDEFASNVYDELQRAFEHLMRPRTGTIAQVANQAGFLWFLGFSPSAWLVNATQTPLISMPMVASKFGMTDTAKAFTSAYKRFFTKDAEHLYSIETSLKGETAEAFKWALESGLIDRTRAHDLAGVAQEGTARSGMPQAFMRAASAGFHHVERMNREITFVAAYELARKSMSDEAAREYASDVVWKTHLDYAAENRPRMLRSDMMRIVGQFKLYSQGITYLQYKTLWDVFKGADEDTKKEAFKFIVMQAGMQFAAAGAMGLPVGGLWMLAQALFSGDDDEPKDFEGSFREAMAELTGSKLGGEIASVGLINALTPIDLHTRTSMRELWLREPDKQLEGKDAELWLLQSIVGPMAGILGQWTAAAKMFNDGETFRGIEKMLPNSANDALKAYRYLTEGAAKTLKGDKLADINATEAFLQMIGFNPSKLEERYSENQATKNTEARLEDRYSTLLRRAADARINRDSDERSAVSAEIKEWNAKHPAKRIMERNITASIKQRQNRRKQAEHGVFVNPKLKDELSGMYRYARD